MMEIRTKTIALILDSWKPLRHRLPIDVVNK